MYVVCVTVRVVPERTDAFLQATLENARQSRQEPGNVRFDVLQAEAEPSQFFLYEVYRGKDDFARHQQAPHYLRWKETVAPWMATPRQGRPSSELFSRCGGMGIGGRAETGRGVGLQPASDASGPCAAAWAGFGGALESKVSARQRAWRGTGHGRARMRSWRPSPIVPRSS